MVSGLSPGGCRDLCGQSVGGRDDGRSSNVSQRLWGGHWGDAWKEYEDYYLQRLIFMCSRLLKISNGSEAFRGNICSKTLLTNSSWKKKKKCGVATGARWLTSHHAWGADWSGAGSHAPRSGPSSLIFDDGIWEYKPDGSANILPEFVHVHINSILLRTISQIFVYSFHIYIKNK